MLTLLALYYLSNRTLNGRLTSESVFFCLNKGDLTSLGVALYIYLLKLEPSSQSHNILGVYLRSDFAKLRHVCPIHVLQWCTE